MISLKIYLKYLILIISLAVIIYLVTFSFFTHEYNSQVIAFSVPEGIAFPILLKIPKLNINAGVEQVGLDSSGAMDVPKDPAGVGWFNLGIIPGEIGSAVVAGHSGYKDNKPAVFDDLDKLSIGDKVYVEDSSGSILVFVVREIRIYNPKDDAEFVFSSDDNKAHLNLITCTGIWNKILKSHSDRLVVFTDLEVI